MKSGSQRTISVPLAVAASIGLVVSSTVQRANAEIHSEYEVKAAYLYNLGRFVEWPPNLPSAPNNAFSICVLGRDPFGPALDTTISGEKIDGKDVVARRIPKVEEAGSCRVLFISSSEDKRLPEILSTTGKLSVLTVSDLPHFVEQGGMVQFVLTDHRVRFEINLAAAHRAGLNLSSELLKVAAKVRGKSGQEE